MNEILIAAGLLTLIAIWGLWPRRHEYEWESEMDRTARLARAEAVARWKEKRERKTE